MIHTHTELIHDCLTQEVVTNKVSSLPPEYLELLGEVEGGGHVLQCGLTLDLHLTAELSNEHRTDLLSHADTERSHKIN